LGDAPFGYVKLGPGTAANPAMLSRLIDTAYSVRMSQESDAFVDLNHMDGWPRHVLASQRAQH
jgi:hypothetical protein